MRKLEIESIPGLNFEARGVFRPTATSRSLAISANEVLPEDGSILDLGCGSGVVGLQLIRNSRLNSVLAMSDISKQATALATQNAGRLGIEVDVRTGSLFEPWEGEFFDSIVSDVSGVVPDLGNRFNWFDGVQNESGIDGTALAKEVLRSASDFLALNGRLVFPVISLSDEIGILNVAREHFGRVTKISEVKVPLPLRREEVPALVADYPFIRVDLVAGMPIFFTSVYSCEN